MNRVTQYTHPNGHADLAALQPMTPVAQHTVYVRRRSVRVSLNLILMLGGAAIAGLLLGYSLGAGHVERAVAGLVAED